jgi:hypothetical protein
MVETARLLLDTLDARSAAAAGQYDGSSPEII